MATTPTPKKKTSSQQLLDYTAKLMTKTIRTAFIVIIWACAWLVYGLIDRGADHGDLIWFNLGLITAALLVGFWAASARVTYWVAKETFEDEKREADKALTRANIDAAMRSTRPRTWRP
jgi:hypothetical protein